ncbi:MAG: RagB/SusD family nutrient uptake outer membrane protein [Tannerella sp.]|nr:RagB/SusD family nutrient uptake outer membrane protein [Tannerella sp.]
MKRMYQRINHTIFGIVTVLLSVGTISSCDYLDVVPDNIATVEQAFSDRAHAEKFLYGCYSFLPHFGSPNHNPAFLSGDEAWLFDDVNTDVLNLNFWRIAKGEQNTDLPLGNYWASKQDSYGLKDGVAIFTGIRDCNIFMENIYIPGDLSLVEKAQWIAETKFLKAFFHFWLLRCYGPIPIIDENLPISVGTEEVQVYRQPIDAVADYIVSLLDEAIIDLPVAQLPTDIGRATKAVAAAIKAQTLVWVASPLLNGNRYYVDHNLTDNRGVQLFPTNTEPDVAKWQRAAEAILEAIHQADTAQHQLYDFNVLGGLTTVPTVDALQARCAATEPWNPEIIWGQLPRDNPNLIQRMSYPPFTAINKQINLLMCYAPPLHIVEQFYTKNGIPIEEDGEWDGVDLYGLRTRTTDDEHQYYILKNFPTANLHFDREARFYGAITFDGSLFYNGGLDAASQKPTYLKYDGAGIAGDFVRDRHSATGYLARKMININTFINATATGPTYRQYSFPIIRLADLYLLYAEALNEINPGPTEEIYEYLDKVRERSGVPDVRTSWQKAKDKQKPYRQDGLREIIHRERLIELAFEGTRFWDLRRWKEAEIYLNKPIRGLNILAIEAEVFNTPQTLYNPKFTDKDYLWPLRIGNLLKNKNLQQNPGWEAGN